MFWETKNPEIQVLQMFVVFMVPSSGVVRTFFVLTTAFKTIRALTPIWDWIMAIIDSGHILRGIEN